MGTIKLIRITLFQSHRMHMKEEKDDDDDKPLAMRKKMKTEPKEKKRKKIKDDDEDDDFKPVSDPVYILNSHHSFPFLLVIWKT